MQCLAECLVGVVLAQLKRRGAAVIIGGLQSSMDMATSILPYGAPEMVLLSAAFTDVAKWLSKIGLSLGVPWRPYALRHAYAGRLWREGGSRLDIYTAARLLGHTAAQHSRTYRAHIQPHLVAEAAERALGGCQST